MCEYERAYKQLVPISNQNLSELNKMDLLESYYKNVIESLVEEKFARQQELLVASEEAGKGSSNNYCGVINGSEKNEQESAQKLTDGDDIRELLH